MSEPRKRWSQKITRDAVLFTTGLALTINESLQAGPERPSLLVLFAGMMGLPAILRFDEQRRNKNGNGNGK